MIVPKTVDDAALGLTTVLENDHPAWVLGTNYIVGNRVIRVATLHSIYECIQAHTASSGADKPDNDVDPVTGVGTYWLRVSATNRWKAFDQRISDQVVHNGDIGYELALDSTESYFSVAMFNIEGNEVEIAVLTTLFVELYSATYSAIETSGIVDWWAYFFNPIEYRSEMVFPYVPATATNWLRAYVRGLTTNKLGQLVYGRDFILGDAVLPLSIGITDYSTKERDTFGNPFIVERAFASRMDIRARIRGTDTNRVKKMLAAVRATPVVFYTHTDDNNLGTMVYGYVTSFNIDPLTPDFALLSLEVEGLI